MHRMPSAVVEMEIDVATSRAPDPDPEVPAKVQRRRFTAEYRRRIVKQADACQVGELGALLRREGLYASHLPRGVASVSRASWPPAAGASAAPCRN